MIPATFLRLLSAAFAAKIWRLTDKLIMIEPKPTDAAGIVLNNI